MSNVPKGSEGPQVGFHLPWEQLKEQVPPRDPELGFYRNHEEKRASEERAGKLMADHRAAEEASLEKERLKRGQGTPIPQPLASPESITLEFAMARDTATAKLSYLYDPYLPSRCVVGFYGRGGSAKSSFLASLAAAISHDDASTLWVSVEELPEWIRVRHIKCDGLEGTLAVVKAVASKTDAQGRVIGSNFNVYEHLEPAIIKAKANFESMYHPPKPLRLVVLDTAVGLTTWPKGESANDDGAVKKLLGYLQALAERHGATIAIIGHSNKGKHDHFADTVAGASAWTNSPRLSFVHARDRREEFACVMQVAKSNLTQRFAATYTTEPVHTLHEREEGADSVLCRVNFGEIVWGEEESSELFEEATRKAREDDDEGGGGHKPSVVTQLQMLIVEMVHKSAQPITRDHVQAQAGREFSRREWSKVDDVLLMAPFQYKVVIKRGEQNRVLYERMP
jgi:hypothetical protein